MSKCVKEEEEELCAQKLNVVTCERIDIKVVRILRVVFRA